MSVDLIIIVFDLIIIALDLTINDVDLTSGTGKQQLCSVLTTALHGTKKVAALDEDCHTCYLDD